MGHAMQRRGLFFALASLACPPGWAKVSATTPLVAAWQQNAQHYIGLLRVDGSRLEPTLALPVPSRAHGLWVQPDASVLAFARRPGDWLLRWHPATGQTQWRWQEDDQRLNGHGLVVPDTDLLLTTQTDRETGLGWLGVRDRTSLDCVDAWPTHGRDPHQLLVLPQALGGLPAGTVLVANGGITTHTETGRSKQQGGPLDASLVALDPQRGALLGQWRLKDPFLSIRHMAWNAHSQQLGLALQAEHPTAPARKAAPVLAVWDGAALSPAVDQPALEGYGGDVIALPRGGYAVGCPRADVLALFSPSGRFEQAIAHPQSCALAGLGDQWWNAGTSGVLSDQQRRFSLAAPAAGVATDAHPTLQIDNHWQPYAG